MINLSCVFLDPSQLQAALRPLWFDIRRLALAHRRNSQAEDQKLLQEVMGLIFRNLPVAEWESRVVDAFLQLACAVLGTDLDRILLGPSADINDNNALYLLADRLCSLTTAASSNISIHTKLNVCGVWLQSRLVAGLDDAQDLDDLWRTTTIVLAPIEAPPDLLTDYLQLQLVLRVARGGALGSSDEGRKAWASACCLALASKRDLRAQLADAASVLGVDLPESVDDVASDQTSEREGAACQTKSLDEYKGILARPETLDEATLDQERQNILFDLTAYATTEDSALKPMTVEQILRLDPSSAAVEMKSPFYFAASDLWNGFSTRGDEHLLALAERVALYAYSYAVENRNPDRDTDRNERSNSLHLWMFTQFPRKMLTCDLSALLADAGRLSAALNAKRNDLWVRQGVVEAFAGQYRALQNQGDTEGREQLVTSYGQQLRTVHEEYLAKADEVGVPVRNEELDAWDSLGLGSLRPKHGDSASTILEDPDFQKVINRGAGEETYQFVCVNKQKIQQILESTAERTIRPGILDGAKVARL